MTTAVAGIVLAMVPILALIGLLRLADRVGRRREARFARQIELTDAIHRELGAVTAPEVDERRGGGWLIRMSVPFERPDTVATILRITGERFAPRGGERTRGYEVVLVRRPTSPDAGMGEARPSVVARPERIAA